jgi:hypothetical protein
MFKKSTIYPFLVAGMIFSYSACKKNLSGQDPLSQLPPLTTKGLNTFGCLVNGKALIIEKPLGDYGLSHGCTYAFSYPGANKPFGFLVWGEDKPTGCDLTSVGIDLDSVDLKSGDSFALTAWSDATGAFIAGKKYGRCIISTTCPWWTTYYTTNTVSGEATIVFIDTVNQIASGTFWFDAINVPGDTIHVREGRFDMHYTN